jgi:hypothetical protein
MRSLIAAAVALLLVFGFIAMTRPAARPRIVGAPLLPLGQAAAAPAPPVLSTEHKLQFQVIMQRLEIAKLKYEAAQADFAGAQREAAALVEQTKIAGYDLDLQTFAYVKTPAPPPSK